MSVMTVRKLMPLMIVVLMLTGTAIAAEDAHGEAGGISPFQGNFGNALWTLIIFFLVLFVLGKFAWRPILNTLQKRESFIRDSLESAKRDREEAEARLKEYEQQIRNARDEASALVDEGRRDADVVRKRIEEDARQAAQEMLERAKREIGIARDSALSDLYGQASDLAMTLARDIIKRELSAEDHQRMMQDALQQIREKGVNPN
jgi:F-type H+-transporting ATPase subunit b